MGAPTEPIREIPDHDKALRPKWRSAGWLMWLAYLGLYFLPWFAQTPSPNTVVAALTGTAVFLAIYFHSYFGRPGSILSHVIAMAMIGFALAPFGGAWSVFNVYAATLATRMRSRRAAMLTVAILQLALLAFGLIFHRVWYTWASGIFFGILASAGTLLQADLERKNRQLLEAQEEVRALAAIAERERIARDLHDLLGHTLTLVAIKADLAGRLIDRDGLGARREMREVAEAARAALGEVRTAVSGMRGATFASELDNAKRMLAVANVRTEAPDDTELGDPKAEAVLAMALREAVTNVIRHAGATRCTIRLDSEPGGDVRLSVDDDGHGGDLRDGSGLAGMRARLSAAGGILRVESGAGGTHLMAFLPRSAA